MHHLESINTTIECASIHGVSFSILTDETTEKLSHVTVTKPQLFLNNEATEYGIYDGHMGSTEEDQVCKTCNLNKRGCLGHSGMFRLKYPVIRPFFYTTVRKVCKLFCHSCSRPLLSSSSLDKCGSCEAPIRKLVKHNQRDLFLYYHDSVGNRKVWYPHLLEQFLDRISDADALRVLGMHQHPRHFIMHNFYVPMNLLRPDIRQVANEKVASEQITSYIQYILRLNENIVPVVSDAQEIPADNLERIRNLNIFVNSLVMGGGANGSGTSSSRTDFKPIVERLRSKDGIIRHNILGRRVHGMGRAVIVCDITLPYDTICIPYEFAKTIQIKETVSPFTFERLLAAVRNGLHQFPGASKVTKANTGKTYSLAFAKNLVLEYGDIVHRDMSDGDVVYLNRQPSLLYSAMTAMKVLINRNPNHHVIGMNVSIAAVLFNADFDGKY